MQLKTLGGLTLKPSEFSRSKPLLLLAYLAVEGVKEKRHLYELFWPEATDPANSLRSVGKLLRKVNPHLLSSEEHTVSTGVENDLAALQTAIAARDADKLLELYKGEFLQGFSLPDWTPELEEWVYSTREFIAARLRGALLVVAETQATQGDFSRATGLAEKAYELGKEDLEPEDLERLYPLLLAGDSALNSEIKKQAKEYGLELALSKEEAKARYFVAPAEGSPETRDIPNNLPKAKTSFIGRDPELVEVGQMLHQPDVQLITLLGPGGMGKTRLALQLAYGQLQEPHFSDGIYFVALDALGESEQIPLALAQTLDLKTKDEPLTAVKAAIGKKHLLLVLDNFEQLMDGVMLVSELLESCPHLTLLVTSRERLNLEEEFVLTLQGLPVSNEANLAEAEYNDAVKLFVQRAKRASLGFQLSSENLPFVLELCKLVEGSPLGIELAAVWLRSLTPKDLVSEISKNLERLETPSHNIVGRHQSLRAVFEHSWKLLKPKEQTTLAMLTVFVGGFTREAASRVTDATIPILTSLVDKSLLKMSQEGRYDRHALLYQFAHEKLLAEGALHEEMQLKHLAYFVGLAEEADAKLHGPNQEQVLELLQGELDNFRAALAFAITAQHVEESLRLTHALAYFWEARGYVAEGLQALKDVLAIATEDHSLLKAEALNKAGLLAMRLSHYEEARGYYQNALELAQERHDNHTAAALRGLGQIENEQSHLSLAQEHLEASLAMYRDLGDKEMTATVLVPLAINFIFQDKRGEARVFFEEALSIHRRMGDQRRIAIMLGNLGALSQELEDYEVARSYYQESLAIARVLKDSSAEATTSANLASLAFEQNDLLGARTNHLSALDIMIRIDAKYDALWCLVIHANGEQKLGNNDLALKIAGAVEEHQKTLELNFPDYHAKVLSEVIETSTQVLGESEAELLRYEGKQMSLAEVLALLKNQTNLVNDKVLARAAGASNFA
jgi:predicted ATPase